MWTSADKKPNWVKRRKVEPTPKRDPVMGINVTSCAPFPSLKTRKFYSHHSQVSFSFTIYLIISFLDTLKIHCSHRLRSRRLSGVFSSTKIWLHAYHNHTPGVVRGFLVAAFGHRRRLFFLRDIRARAFITLLPRISGHGTSTYVSSLSWTELKYTLSDQLSHSWTTLQHLSDLLLLLLPIPSKN